MNNEIVIISGLAATALAFLLANRARSRPRPRTPPTADAALLDEIIQRQSGTTDGSSAPPAASRPRAPAPGAHATADPALAALEGHLRNAILDAAARERLVCEAMRSVGDHRAAAIRKVLRDLHDEDKRWS